MACSSVGKSKGKVPVGCEPKIKFSARGHVRDYRTAKAYIGNVIVGYFDFRLDKGLIKAQGTSVHPNHQKKGIGSAMWSAMIKKYNPASVSVSTISESGENLVRKMKKLHPEIDWDWW